MFIDCLIENIKQKNNPSMVGLDPKIDYVPQFIKSDCFAKYGNTLQAAAEAIFIYNKFIIDAVAPIVPAVKPQSAYYEMYGVYGVEAYAKTIKYAKDKGMIVIADGKRNDIGSTAACYSQGYLGFTQINDTAFRAFMADALTVTPYLGADGIEPFVKDCKAHNKGIFVLVKTSNPSSGQFQDLITSKGTKVYEEVAEYVNALSAADMGKYGYGNIGAVVGATYPEEAASLRKIMKNSYFLVPGYGFQGGTGESIKNCFDNNRMGAIVSASRSIILAYKNDKYKNRYKEDEFYKASSDAAIDMREDINNTLKNI